MGNIMAGLTSLPRKKNIKGQPHKLAYITDSESDILKFMGGAGKPVQGTKGVPAYFGTGEGMGGYGSGEADDATGGMGDPDAGVAGEDIGVDYGYGLGRGYPGMRGDPRDFGFNVEDARAAQEQADREAAREAAQQAYEDKMAGIYGRVPGFKSRAEEYTDFFGVGKEAGRVGAAKGFLEKDRFSTLLGQVEEKGYAPASAVLNSFGIPVETRFGYLTQEGLEKENPAFSKKYKQPRFLPEDKKRYDKFDFENVERPNIQMMADPVIQNMLYNPSIENRKAYTEAIAPFSQAMTLDERYGVLDPNISPEDPRFGTRVGGFLSTLEQAGLPTYMGGLRGSRETDAPFALTKAEADRYQDIFMAFDGTKGGAIRAALDAAKPGDTVEGLLGGDAFGLPPNAEASALSNYMDREALQGWFQGLGIVTSLTSPFMPAVAMGVPQEIYKETIQPALNSLKSTLRENIPGFEKVEKAFDVGVKTVEKEYEDRIPAAKEVLDTIFNAIGGDSKAAAEFGSSYNLPTTSALPSPEPTVEDIAPVVTDIGSLPPEVFFDPDPIGPPLDLTGGLRSSPSAVPAVSEADRAVERAALPMSDAELASIMDIINTNTTVDPVVTDIGSLPPEAFFNPDPFVEDTPRGSEAPIIEDVANMPVTRSTNISSNVINNTLNTVANMIQQPGSVITATDYLAIQNATTEEEFIEAVQAVIDKDKQSGPAATAERESGFVYERGN
tara:strand:- start:711 stop:2888 length:2178 start_codon:yes stop_codon:yes gene_type:complete